MNGSGRVLCNGIYYHRVVIYGGVDQCGLGVIHDRDGGRGLGVERGIGCSLGASGRALLGLLLLNSLYYRGILNRGEGEMTIRIMIY